MFGSRSVRRSLSAAVLAGVCALVVGCGDDVSKDASATPSAGTGEFPAATFKPEVFKGLSGTVTWYDVSGGATTKAKEASIFPRFQKLTGVTVKSDFNSDTTKFFAAMQAGQAPWNLIEFPTVGDFLHAKEKGYLEKLDPAVVPLDKLEDGSYDEYGYHAERYGIVLTWNTKKFADAGSAPTSMKDLFDTQKFPGKRCMYKYPEFGATLESALLADGVTTDQMYPLDVDRAFKKLDTIKKDIVWYSSGDQAIQLLTRGECDLGVAWTGRVYSAVQKDKAPLDFTWQDGMYADAVFGIPKGAPDVRAAQAMLAMWILDDKGQGDYLNGVPYPTPITGYEAPAGLEKWLPAGDNLSVALAQDDAYYAKEIDNLSKRFTAWVGG